MTDFLASSYAIALIGFVIGVIIGLMLANWLDTSK